MTSAKRLGIYVNDKYGWLFPEDVSFFAFRHFVETSWPILSRYELLVTDRTAEILNQIKRDLKGKGSGPDWKLSQFQNSRVLVNELVKSSQQDVERMLFFLDPYIYEKEIGDLLVLRDAVAQHGQKLHINCSAQLWAEREWEALVGIKSKFLVGADDAIVLLRQSSTQEIDRFILRNLPKVMHFPRLVFTSQTRQSMINLLDNAKQFAYITPETFSRIQDMEILLSENQDAGDGFYLFASAGAREDRKNRLYLTDKNWDAPENGNCRIYFTEKKWDILHEIGSLLVRIYAYVRDIQMGGRMCHLVACPGHNPEPEQAKALEDLICLLAAPQAKVNLILDPQTAEEWMQPPLESRMATEMIQ